MRRRQLHGCCMLAFLLVCAEVDDAGLSGGKLCHVASGVARELRLETRPTECRPIGGGAHMAKNDMEERFSRFALTLSTAESIDALVPSATSGQRADYLWRGRSVVVEQKVLTGDPQAKVERAFDALSEREDAPLFVGPSPVDKIFRHLPDGAERLRKLRQQVMRSTEAAFRDARRQIANTKKLFELPDALGMLVVLNPNIETLSPIDVGQELSRLMEKRQSEGWAVDVVWLLSEAHLVGEAQPCILITGSRIGRFEWASFYLDGLNAAWARFNNSPITTIDVEQLIDVSVRNASEARSEPLTRSEMWRKRYQANPYFRSFDDATLKQAGTEIFASLMPYFLKGGPRWTMAELEPLMIRWSDFLEEARQRGLNMRGFGLPAGMPSSFNPDQ